MSWLSFTARRWFSAAVTIARRCDGRAWNVSHTKFLSPISKLQPKPNPASCHFSCVQIEIELCSVRNERKTGAEGEGEMSEREPEPTRHPAPSRPTPLPPSRPTEPSRQPEPSRQ